MKLQGIGCVFTLRACSSVVNRGKLCTPILGTIIPILGTLRIVLFQELERNEHRVILPILDFMLNDDLAARDVALVA